MKGRTLEEIKEEDLGEEVAELIVSILKDFYKDEVDRSSNGRTRAREREVQLFTPSVAEGYPGFKVK